MMTVADKEWQSGGQDADAFPELHTTSSGQLEDEAAEDKDHRSLAYRLLMLRQKQKAEMAPSGP